MLQFFNVFYTNVQYFIMYPPSYLMLQKKKLFRFNRHFIYILYSIHVFTITTFGAFCYIWCDCEKCACNTAIKSNTATKNEVMLHNMQRMSSRTRLVSLLKWVGQAWKAKKKTKWFVQLMYKKSRVCHKKVFGVSKFKTWIFLVNKNVICVFDKFDQTKIKFTMDEIGLIARLDLVRSLKFDK